MLCWLTLVSALCVSLLRAHECSLLQSKYCEPSPVVTTDNGLVQGFTKLTEGQNVSVFLGIPFAEPPIGSRRFWLPRGLREEVVWSSPCNVVVKYVSPTQQIGWPPSRKRGLSLSQRLHATQSNWSGNIVASDVLDIWWRIRRW